jgi:hypothetical protein
VIGNAARVMQIATGEVEEGREDSPAQALGRLGGTKAKRAALAA